MPVTVEMVTVLEAARILRLSERFLYGLPQETPGIYRFGGAVRIDLAEFRAWARRGSCEAGV